MIDHCDPQLGRTRHLHGHRAIVDRPLESVVEQIREDAFEQGRIGGDIDLGLPDVSGLTVIRRLRQWSSVPIIVLSARDAELDKVAALEAGADDYVSKPFGMGELIARVRASLRRSVVGQSEPIVKTAHFTIDLARRTVVGELGESKLTPTEWSIVEHLVRNPERLVSSKELLQVVWGPEYSTETNYLRVHLTHIRQKLEPDPPRPVYFVTEPGMGYRFVPNPR